MIFIRYLHAWPSASNPFSISVPLATRAFFLAIVFAVPWFVWFLFDPRKSSLQHESSRKGETP